MRDCKGSPKREVHSHPSLSKKIRKIPNAQANHTPKGLGERIAN